jgi:hypothetical protein
MIRSRTVIALFVAIPTLSVPAGAQFVPRRTYPPVAAANPFLPDSRLPGPGAWREVGFLRDRIGRASEAGLISRREARRLRRQTDRIAERSLIYGRDGLSSFEQAEIESRARAVDSAIAQAAVSED